MWESIDLDLHWPIFMPHSVSQKAARLARHRNCLFVIFENILKSIQGKRVNEFLVSFYHENCDTERKNTLHCLFTLISSNISCKGECQRSLYKNDVHFITNSCNRILLLEIVRALYQFSVLMMYFYVRYRFEYTSSVDSPVNDCFNENPQKCTVAAYDCEGHAQAVLNKLLTYLSYLIEESVTHSWLSRIVTDDRAKS